MKDIKKKEKNMHLRKNHTKNIFISLDKEMKNETFIILVNQKECRPDYQITRIQIVHWGRGPQTP